MGINKRSDTPEVKMAYAEAAYELCMAERKFSSMLSGYRKELEYTQSYLDSLPVLTSLARTGREAVPEEPKRSRKLRPDPYINCVNTARELAYFLDLRQTSLADALPKTDDSFKARVYSLPRNRESIKRFKKLTEQYENSCVTVAERFEKDTVQIREKSTKLPVTLIEYFEHGPQFNENLKRLKSSGASLGEQRKLAVRTFPGLIGRYTLHPVPKS